jgi:hypothetical protein
MADKTRRQVFSLLLQFLRTSSHIGSSLVKFRRKSVELSTFSSNFECLSYGVVGVDEMRAASDVVDGSASQEAEEAQPG